MPLRRGQEFLESLRDGRQVWLDGQRVEDVTTHPQLAGCARAVARIYDLHHDPAYRELLTMPSPRTGELVSLAYIEPRTREDLVRRRKMTEFLMRRTGAVAGRLPEYMATIVLGLYEARDILAEEDPSFARHLADYYAYCRESDVCLTHGFADPPRDQRVPRKDFATLKVVDEGPDGVVIHGVKAVATLAPYANEYLGLTSPRPELASEEVVYFSVPMDSEGLRVHCRPSLAHPAGADHRLSACFDEMDAWVVFDHVFVPPERVFYRRRVDVNAKLFGRVLWWAYYHVLIRMAVKAEVLAGICVAMADYLGTAEAPHMQMALVEVISYVETLRAFIRAAEDEPIRAPSGLLIPNPTQVTLGRLHGVERHPQILQIVREVCGSGILMAPGEAEMRDPEAGADVYQYLVGPDARAPERFRLLKLAWEYAADSFGSRQLLFEMHNAGSVLTTKSRLVSAYDSGPLVRLAKELAGIGAEELARPE